MAKNTKVWIRIKDIETGKESEPVAIEDVIFNQRDIEFVFPDYDEYGEATLPYTDFLFYQEEYEVIVKIEGK